MTILDCFSTMDSVPCLNSRRYFRKTSFHWEETLHVAVEQRRFIERIGIFHSWKRHTPFRIALLRRNRCLSAESTKIQKITSQCCRRAASTRVCLRITNKGECISRSIIRSDYQQGVSSSVASVGSSLCSPPRNCLESGISCSKLRTAFHRYF